MQYNIAGWLDKNKDPINDTVVQCLAASVEPLVALFFGEPKEGMDTKIISSNAILFPNKTRDGSNKNTFKFCTFALIILA